MKILTDLIAIILILVLCAVGGTSFFAFLYALSEGLFFQAGLPALILFIFICFILRELCS